jgi:hypothetical protein
MELGTFFPVLRIRDVYPRYKVFYPGSRVIKIRDPDSQQRIQVYLTLKSVTGTKLSEI